MVPLPIDTFSSGYFCIPSILTRITGTALPLLREAVTTSILKLFLCSIFVSIVNYLFINLFNGKTRVFKLYFLHTQKLFVLTVVRVLINRQTILNGTMEQF